MLHAMPGSAGDLFRRVSKKMGSIRVPGCAARQVRARWHQSFRVQTYVGMQVGLGSVASGES